MDEYVLINKTDLTSIANRVRSISGSTGTMNALDIGVNLDNDVGSVKETLTAWLIDKGEKVEDGASLKELADIIGGISNDGGSGGGDEWFNDGNTHIWITLHDGRTSPMLGVCPNGTVTVDWGDGTAPDTLTGKSTSTVKWTPTHNYAESGDYVITLTVDGEMGFSGTESDDEGACLLRYRSGANSRNKVYQAAMRKIEIGNGVTSIVSDAFNSCKALASVLISEGVTSIDARAFQSCNALASVVISEGVTSIGAAAFFYCYALNSVVIPESVMSIGNSAFKSCNALASVLISEGVTSIGNSAFQYCYALNSVVISEGVTSIGSYAFSDCHGLASIVIPSSVKTIEDRAFNSCYGLRYCDFTKHTAVPTLSGTSVFNNAPSEFEIRVPAALADEWKAATNWATYANQIVGV